MSIAYWFKHKQVRGMCFCTFKGPTLTFILLTSVSFVLRRIDVLFLNSLYDCIMNERLLISRLSSDNYNMMIRGSTDYKCHKKVFNCYLFTLLSVVVDTKRRTKQNDTKITISVYVLVYRYLCN